MMIQKIQFDSIRGSINCAHGDERARNVHLKRFSRARKSIKTPSTSSSTSKKVSSTPDII